MIIRELNMKNFGKFCNKTIKLKQGINVIYGDNEKGKTTTHSFIKGMFFGIDKPRGRASKDNMYEKYMPWDNMGAYEGSMLIENDCHEYLLQRIFNKDIKSFSCINETLGRQLDIKDITSLPFLKNMTESRYKNTISNEQLKSRVDKDLAKEVKNYIANLSTSKDREVDVCNAFNILKDKKKTIDAKHTQSKLDEITSQMKEDDKVEERVAELSEKIEELKKEEKKAPSKNEEKSISIIKEYVDGYDEIKEKYKKFVEIREKKDVLMDIDEKVDDDDSKKNIAKNKFPLLVIVCTCIINALILNKFGTNTNGLIWSIVVVIIAAYIIYAYSDRVARLLIEKECKHQMEKKKSSKENLDKYNQMMLDTQNEILEYAGRICPLKELNDEEMFRLEKEVVVLKNQMEGYVYKQKKEEQDLEMKIEKLNWELEMLENDEPVRISRKKKYNELLSDLEKEEKEKKAIEVTKTVIEDLSNDIHSNFGIGLQHIISKYCEIFTGKKYNKVLVDNDFNLKVMDQGRYVDIEKLSIGTIEQIYLAVRFAVTELFEDGTKMPIILDDSFAFYDNKRLIATLRSLSKMTDRQIIIFTCHNREANILKRENMKYNYVEL